MYKENLIKKNPKCTLCFPWKELKQEPQEHDAAPQIEGILYETKRQPKVHPESLQMVIPMSGVPSDVDLSGLTRHASSGNLFIARKKSTLYTNADSAVIPQQELTRTIPQNIHQDKETLYQQVVTLKDQINQLHQERNKLLARLRFLETDNDKISNIAATVGQYLKKERRSIDSTKMTKLGISENLLTVTLKKQIRDQKHELKNKEELINKLQQTTRYTKIKEMEIELSEVRMESMRLRTLLDQSLRNEAITRMSHDFNQYEEKFYTQMQLINALKQENDNLYGVIKISDEEKFTLQNEIDGKNKQINQLEQQIENLKVEINDGRHQIERLILKIEGYESYNQELFAKCQTTDKQEAKINLLALHEASSQQKIKELTSQIEYLDKVVNEQKIKLAEKSTYEMREKRFLQEEVHKYQRLYEEIDDKHKNMLLYQAQARHKETLVSVHQRQQMTVNIQYMNNRKHNAHMTPDSQFMRQLDYAPKKLRTVRLADVKDIGLELNYRFQLKKIEMVDVIEKYLFEDSNKKSGFITVKDLIERFDKEPFLIKDKDQALLFARYLIEDNTEDFVEFKIILSNTLIIVRSIFVKTVGMYKVLSYQEDNQMLDSIRQIIHKYINSLKQHMDSLPTNQEGTLTKQEILNTFIFMDIDLSQEQLDYLFLQLFATSNNVKRFSYGKIFDLFCIQQILPMEDELKSKRKKKKVGEASPRENREQIFEFANRRQTLNLQANI